MIEFILHGYGSCASMLRQWWPCGVIGTKSHFLEGPEFDLFTSQRRWFAFSLLPKVLQCGLELATLSAEQQIYQALEEFGLSTDAPIVLIGHSQGAMVIFDLLRQHRLNVVEARCYAGYLPQTQFKQVERIDKSATDLIIYSSSVDRYIDPIEVACTARYFEEVVGLNVRHYQTFHLSHAFSRDWLVSTNFDLKVKDE